jgi:hypothetical protein
MSALYHLPLVIVENRAEKMSQFVQSLVNQSVTILPMFSSSNSSTNVRCTHKMDKLHNEQLSLYSVMSYYTEQAVC